MPDLRDADDALLASAGRAAEAAELARRVPGQVSRLQEMMGLPAPAWLNDSGSKLPDGACVVYSGPYRCQARATHWAWIGCTAGEHLDRSAVCGQHAGSVTALPPLHCERCWNVMRAISDARFIRIEEMRDDDGESAVRSDPGLAG